MRSRTRSAISWSTRSVEWRPAISRVAASSAWKRAVDWSNSARERAASSACSDRRNLSRRLCRGSTQRSAVRRPFVGSPARSARSRRGWAPARRGVPQPTGGRAGSTARPRGTPHAFRLHRPGRGADGVGERCRRRLRSGRAARRGSRQTVDRGKGVAIEVGAYQRSARGRRPVARVMGAGGHCPPSPRRAMIAAWPFPVRDA